MLCALCCHCRGVINTSPDLSNLLRVSVFNTGVLYTDTVDSVCGGEAGGAWASGALILIVLRLGLATLNPAYVPEMARVLRMRHCVGILGGTPAHSIYCVGVRGDHVLYLDPHTTQAAWVPGASSASADKSPTASGCEGGDGTPEVNTGTVAAPECVSDALPGRYLDSFTPTRASYTPIASLDPSLAVAFHCRDRLEFTDLCDELRRVLAATDTPLFGVGRCEPVYDPCACGEEEGLALTVPGVCADAAVSVGTPLVFQEEGSGDDGEFVIVHTCVGMSDEVLSPQ